MQKAVTRGFESPATRAAVTRVAEVNARRDSGDGSWATVCTNNLATLLNGDENLRLMIALYDGHPQVQYEIVDRLPTGLPTDRDAGRSFVRVEGDKEYTSYEYDAIGRANKVKFYTDPGVVRILRTYGGFGGTAIEAMYIPPEPFNAGQAIVYHADMALDRPGIDTVAYAAGVARVFGGEPMIAAFRRYSEFGRMLQPVIYELTSGYGNKNAVELIPKFLASDKIFEITAKLVDAGIDRWSVGKYLMDIYENKKRTKKFEKLVETYIDMPELLRGILGQALHNKKRVVFFADMLTAERTVSVLKEVVAKAGADVACMAVTIMTDVPQLKDNILDAFKSPTTMKRLSEYLEYQWITHEELELEDLLKTYVASPGDLRKLKTELLNFPGKKRAPEEHMENIRDLVAELTGNHTIKRWNVTAGRALLRDQER